MVSATSIIKHMRTHPSQPFIVQRGNLVTLRFQDGEIQSRMHASTPDALALTYTRTMLAFMLLNGTPRHIVMIGLGGGSMPKWCYRNLPDTCITIAEINRQVIDLRERFSIPADNDRFRIFCADGADYIASNANASDALLIDGFDHTGQPPQLMTQKFYDDCYLSLANDGLMIANLCGPTDEAVAKALSRIRKSFDGRVQFVVPEDSENRIVLAIKGKRLPIEEEPTEAYLQRFQQLYGKISRDATPQASRR